MNKTKLEVIRISEDVIATSGTEFCSNHRMHFYFAGNVTENSGSYRPDDDPNSHSYNYVGDEWLVGSLRAAETTYFNSQPVGNIYYVLNESGKMEICNKNHYPETIKKN